MDLSLRHAAEIAEGNRFDFGDNWRRFLERLSEERIALAEQSLRQMLDVDTLSGQTFLDIGSGSGLFSLSARRLGAHVRSFDYDPMSVACTRELKRRYFSHDPRWTVELGSVLDPAYLKPLGQFDVVYSWGVLHHTGAMKDALVNVATLVKPGGRLFIAIYNDQGSTSRHWLKVKQAYNHLPAHLRWWILWPAFLRLWGPTTVRDLLKRRPFETWRTYATGSVRGMTPWRDVVDWVGGLPFEVATPDVILAFFRDRGFQIQQLRTCDGGRGCNEFVFCRQDPC